MQEHSQQTVEKEIEKSLTCCFEKLQILNCKQKLYDLKAL